MDIENIKERVIYELSSYTGDVDLVISSIDYTINSEIREILNFCAIDTLPSELEHVVVRRVLGQLLNFIVQVRGNEGVNIDSVGISSIKEGDVSISYNNSLDKASLIFRFIKNSKEYGKDELYSFRKLRW